MLHQLTRSVKLKPWPGDTKSYLRQPVIVSPVIQQMMEEPQTAVLSWLGLISVAYWWSMHAGWPAASKSTSSETLVVSIETMWLERSIGRWGIVHIVQCRVCHTDKPQSGQKVCLWFFHPLLDDLGGNHWLPQIGLRVPRPLFQFYWPGQVA